MSLFAADKTIASAEAQADAVMLEYAKFQKIDALRPQGRTTNLPDVYDSIFNDVDGWRSKLAESGLYFRGQTINSATYNILDNARPRDPQIYNGQQLTVGGSLYGTMSIKLAGEGRDIAQLNVGLESSYNDFEGIGPRKKAQMAVLEYFQSFHDRRIEVCVGFNANIVNFVGIFAGGNPLLAAGYAGVIPVEVGMSADPATAPTLNITFNGENGFYNKSGIQRSISPTPNGIADEADDNHFGLRFARKGAKVLFINETGILHPAGANGPQMWLRVGGMFNTSDYQRYDGGTARNWALYAMADYQLVKTHPREPYRGVFIGASAMFGPSTVNVYSQYYEARVYGVGLFPNRPTDLCNLTFAYNGFSHEAGRTIGAITQLPVQRNQYSASVLYSCHLGRGVYLSPSVTYLAHPSFVGNFKPALNTTLGLTVMF